MVSVTCPCAECVYNGRNNKCKADKINSHSEIWQLSTRVGLICGCVTNIQWTMIQSRY